MSRMQKVYEHRFRTLLLRLRARRLDAGIDWLNRNACQRAAGPPTARSLSDRYEHLRDQVKRWEHLTQSPSARGAESRLRFICDAGLGGLARWLRAAGYETFWFPDIEDAELLRQAEQLQATVLTTDSLMMERGVLRDGIIPALWLPPALTKQEQLGLVLREFSLATHEPRCMSCGGELRPVNKESMRARIPPKTWRWIDDYFACARCGQLFWHGTHWQKIQEELKRRGGPRM